MKFKFIIALFLYSSALLFGNNDASDDLVQSMEDLLNTKINTASKYEQNINEAPASVSIISKDDFKKYGWNTLADAINSIRGFFIRNDRNYTYIGARGFESLSNYGKHFLLLLNGHTINDNFYWGTYYGNDFGIDVDNIERVEIVRGPSSVLYGSGAMLGVINVITKKTKDIEGLRISGEYASFGTSKLGLTFAKQINSDFDASGAIVWGYTKGQDLYFKEFDTPDNNYGIAQNLDWENHFGLHFNSNYKNFSTQFYYNTRNKGIPTAPWKMAFNHSFADCSDDRAFGEIKYSHIVNENYQYMARSYFDYYKYSGRYAYLTDLNEYYNAYDKNTGHWIGSEFNVICDMSQNSRLTLGAEYKYSFTSDYSLSDDINGETYYNNYPYNIWSVFAQEYFQLFDNLSFRLGLQFNSFYNTERAFNPNFAVIYNPFQNTTLKLLYSEGFRAPNNYEKYYADSTTIKTNPNLESERIKSAELVIEQIINKNMFFTFSAFQYQLNNLIEDFIDPMDGLEQFRNYSKIDAYGIESELKLDFEHLFQGFLNITYQYSKNSKTDSSLTNYPIGMIKAGISRIFYQSIITSLETQYQTSRKTIKGYDTEDFFIANFNIIFKPNFDNNLFSLLNHCEFSFLIRNIFDTKYYFPASNEHNQISILQDGRSYLLDLTIKL